MGFAAAGISPPRAPRMPLMVGSREMVPYSIIRRGGNNDNITVQRGVRPK